MSDDAFVDATTGLRWSPIDPATDPVQSDAPASDPIALAAEWLPANDDVDRPRVTIATNGLDGYPDARTVLLTELDGDRFYFHTDGASRKAAQLAADPRATMVVLWPRFTRQLVVQGTVEVADAEETASAYRRRSPYLKELAWLNTPELAQRPLGERIAAWSGEAARFSDVDAAAPATWAGYALRAERLVFWVANPDTASRRAEFTRTPDGWTRRLLPG